MIVKVVAYGIARDILKSADCSIDLKEATTIAGLKEVLLQQYPDFSKLASLRFAVGEEYQTDSYTLVAGQEVVIIPPVSGG